MFPAPMICNLEESVRSTLIDSIRSRRGVIVVLSACASMLSVAKFVLDDVVKAALAEGLNIIDMVDVDRAEDDRNLARLDSVDENSVVVFRELRKQGSIVHSAELASRYVEAGATVIAVVHGLNLDSVKIRLNDVGFRKNLIESNVGVALTLTEDTPHFWTS